MEKQKKSAMVGITEITRDYLPVSRRKARQFVALYLEPKRIGNRIYVYRQQLEMLLASDREKFPLNL